MYCIAVHDVDFNFMGFVAGYSYFTKDYRLTRNYTDRLKWYEKENAEEVISYIKDTNRFIITECN
jgi:hypothetical protein